MPMQIFVNLPVKDLNKSMAFFNALGFSFNPQFTHKNAACPVFSDDIYAMLLVEPYFKTFIKKPISHATETAEVITALSFDS